MSTYKHLRTVSKIDQNSKGILAFYWKLTASQVHPRYTLLLGTNYGDQRSLRMTKNTFFTFDTLQQATFISDIL